MGQTLQVAIGAHFSNLAVAQHQAFAAVGKAVDLHSTLFDTDPQPVGQPIDHETGAQYPHPCQTAVNDEGPLRLAGDMEDCLTMHQFCLALAGLIAQVQVSVGIEDDFGSVSQVLRLLFADARVQIKRQRAVSVGVPSQSAAHPQ
ncbi:hypothetical protein D3C77_596710 [compost metagenome]